jgi:Xaa-Pro dipeptidase
MTSDTRGGRACEVGSRGFVAEPAVDDDWEARNLVFPEEEYRERLRRTQAEMGKADIPVLILHQPESICWLSGFWHDGFFAYHALVVPAEGEPVLVLRALEEPVAEELSWVAHREMYPEDENAVRATERVLRRLNLDDGRVGVEGSSWFLTVRRFDALCGLLPRADFVREPDIINGLMLVKSPREVERIRAAARIAGAAVEAGVEATREGASEYQIAAAISAAQAISGHDGFMGGMGGTISSGYRVNQLHAQQSGRQLRSGDLVHLELPGISRQYWAKFMRTAVVGEPTDDLLRAEEIVRRAQDEGISRMAPGVAASEVTEACRGPILNARLRETYDNRVGYGLGLQFHPTTGYFDREFVPGADWFLEPGMVFHMLLSARGVAFSETVVVTHDGHEVLTDLERRVFVR